MPTLSGYRKVTLPGSYFVRIDKGHFVRNLRQSDEIYKKKFFLCFCAFFCINFGLAGGKSRKENDSLLTSSPTHSNVPKREMANKVHVEKVQND